MDQVSRPLLALLLATVGLAGTWMLVLRPHKDATADAPLVAPKHTAPGVKGLGRAVDHAKNAVATQERSNERVQSATGGTAAAKAAPAVKPAPAKPAPAPKAATPIKPVKVVKVVKVQSQPGSAHVNALLSQGKSVVLLFAGNGADDSVARDVVRSVGTSKVVPVVASMHDLDRYADITSHLDITQSPTILVISPTRQAVAIVGLPDAKQIQSALRTVVPHGKKKS